MPVEVLNILLLQADIIWKETKANLQKYARLIDSVDKPVDLIILPEMFNTGFVTAPDDIVNYNHKEVISWLQHTARISNSCIAGSIIFIENNKYFNRLLCMHPDGRIDSYDKRHLFRMAGEEEHYIAGNSRTISTIKGWKICWQICYDLRFPVWSRNKGDYDVLVYVACWPAQRSDVWNTLLKARAIENQSYVIGVNRVGEDGNKITYMGESMALGPKGNILNDIYVNEEKLIFTQVNYTELIAFRKKFPVLQDADQFNIKNSRD
jgi:predicted amidohydrolase